MRAAWGTPRRLRRLRRSPRRLPRLRCRALGMGRKKGGSGGGVLPAVDNAAALAAAAAEVARLNEAARAAREAVTAAEAVVQPVMEASIASALVVPAERGGYQGKR